MSAIQTFRESMTIVSVSYRSITGEQLVMCYPIASAMRAIVLRGSIISPADTYVERRTNETVRLHKRVMNTFHEWYAGSRSGKKPRRGHRVEVSCRHSRIRQRSCSKLLREHWHRLTQGAHGSVYKLQAHRVVELNAPSSIDPERLALNNLDSAVTPFSSLSFRPRPLCVQARRPDRWGRPCYRSLAHARSW